MTDRLNKIFQELSPCKVFADIGCDHGYIAKKMITEKLCKKVIVSDISEKCLEKAKSLLSRELISKKAVAVVSDGFTSVPKCDQALIAGMGGEEIIHILNSAKKLPKRIAVQPMKNADKVRSCIVNVGYKIEKDFVFYSAKQFYTLIIAKKGKDSLTEEEILFGRTNIIDRPIDFQKMIKEKIEKLENFSCGEKISSESKSEILNKIKRLKDYVK
ncbi:MAG: class I SAM-dependent methyltransferase [Clostridia bacterium]|nr:class I SAM-dependent methyltransferase [Clostridia bacterium]